MRKVFTDKLPRYRGNNIDWIHSVGIEILFIYDNIEGIIKILDYDQKTHNLNIMYKNMQFKINSCVLCRCELRAILGKIKYDYIYKVKDIINGLKILGQVKISHGNSTDRGYKCQCVKDGYTRIISEYNLIRGSRCPICAGRIAWIGHNDIHTVAPWMEDWVINPDEIKNLLPQSGKKVKCKCPECGRYIGKKTVEAIYVHGVGCMYCSDGVSYPEKFMFNLLKQLKVNSEHQKYFSWCKYKMNDKLHYGLYDFYLPDYKLIIETDGGLGHGYENTMSGRTAEETRYIDDEKDKLARDHGIESIRIICTYEKQYKLSRFEYIRNNILQSSLSKLFDLTKIDWIDIDQKSQKSLVKKVCEYKKENPDLLPVDISKKTGLKTNCIRTYLKIGNQYGWCNYNPKDSFKGRHECISKLMKSHYKKVICLNTNIIFKSMAEASQIMHTTHIVDCCKHKRKYAGKLPDGTKLKWMYYDDYLKANSLAANKYEL